MRKGKFVIQHSKKLTLQKVQKEALNRKENMVSDPLFINQTPIHQDPPKLHLSRNRSLSKLKTTDNVSSRRSSLEVHTSNDYCQDRTPFLQLDDKPKSIRNSHFRQHRSSFYNRKPGGPTCFEAEGALQGGSQLQKQQILSELTDYFKYYLVIFQTNPNSYSIKKDRFNDLVLYFLSSIAKDKREIRIREELPGLDFMADLVRKMENYSREGKMQERRGRLCVTNQILNCCYSNESYRLQKASTVEDVAALQNIKSNLQGRLAEMHQQQTDLGLACRVVENKITVGEKYSKELMESIKGQQTRLEQLLQKVKFAANECNFLQIEQQKLLNYVSRQENQKMLQQASKEYKQIQSDIYEYAVYLQSNQLASALDFQPRPFNEIERQINEDMKTVNKLLIHVEQSPEAKSRAMRDFVLKAMELYRKKDAQMAALCEFKTKCIRQFVAHMKKWLGNWQLKQEYLGNLRREFLLDSKAVHQHLQQLTKMQVCLECTKVVPPLTEAIEESFIKIEKNYQLGNLFY